jgi:hypothetical protein
LAKSFKTRKFANTPGKKDPGVNTPQGILYPRERQNPLKLSIQASNPIILGKSLPQNYNIFVKKYMKIKCSFIS